MTDLKQLKQSDLLKLKKELHEAQNEHCPILNSPFPLDEMVVDHIHKRKRADEPNEENGGLVRGAINRYANIVLGKIENSWRRTGLEGQGYNLADALRRMADYIEADALPYIHPTEKIPEKKLKKSCYNKLAKHVKEINPRAKVPPYPKSGKFTKALEKVFIKYDFSPEFY